MTEKRMKLEDLKPGPIRHETLPPDLLARVETLRLVLCDVYPMSSEEWRENLQRDLNPEREVSWWEGVAGCFTAVVARREFSSDQKHATFKIIFGLFAGSGAEDLTADIEKLSESDMNELGTIINTFVKTNPRR
jgi:hypothetical protein